MLPEICHRTDWLLCAVGSGDLVGKGGALPVCLRCHAATCGLAVALIHRWNVAKTGAQARVVADLLQRSQDGLVCVLPAARMLLAGVDVIPVHVNDVPIAWADKLR